MLSVNNCTGDRALPSSVEEVLVARYTGFAGWLRANDFRVTTSDIAASMEVAQLTGQTNSQILRWSLRVVLCSRAEEWRRFDDLFDAYFLMPNRRVLAETRAGGTGQIERDKNAGQHDDSEGMPLSLAGRGGDFVHADGSVGTRAPQAKPRSRMRTSAISTSRMNCLQSMTPSGVLPFGCEASRFAVNAARTPDV